MYFHRCIDFVDIAKRSSIRLVLTSNWSNFGILSRRAGLSATAGLSCPASFPFGYFNQLCDIWTVVGMLQIYNANEVSLL